MTEHHNVYLKWTKGDPVNKEELAAALKYYDDLRTSLRESGSPFSIEYSRVFTIYRGLKSHSDARSSND